MNVIHFECPPFDILLQLVAAIFILSKGVFISKTYSSKLYRTPRTIRGFSKYNKHFFGIEFSEKVPSPTEEYIRLKSRCKSKHKFLILAEFDGVLKTRLKNRIHRSIYLEISHTNGKGIITDCHYYDRAYKRNNAYITPSGLTSIIFEFSPECILQMVNDELNCGFTDVIITKDTFGFDDDNLPICGSI